MLTGFESGKRRAFYVLHLLDNTREPHGKRTAKVASFRSVDKYQRSEIAMALDLMPGESRGYWKYHVPSKLFKQAKAT
ncbi:hypothetical protein P3T76_001633 [Phytophthora citrophthora]|uniref:Uncharacterized protein n=1 Tax=Phytophthora citrophthora TaxID=4793 RepID=A0AAD9H0F7_9STRA|nr:hypothetical protein P3T76_001633 [Phytophthora citrophthora]